MNSSVLKFLLLTLCTCVFFAAHGSKSDAAGEFDWKAQARLSKAVSKIEREKKHEIAIIYSGNTGGELVPYPHTQDALGGLSRGASVINTIRKGYPVNFSVNVGNMLNKSSDPIREKLTAAYYDYMKFDAVAPGVGELTLGIPEFTAKLPAVISNMRDTENKGIANARLIENGGYKIYAINLIGKSLIADEEISSNISTNIGRVKSLLDREEAKGADLRIAVVHAQLDEIMQMAQGICGIDIIIAGSLSERFDTPVKAGSAIIVSAGSQGRFIGSLSVRFDENKNRISTVNKLYPVYQNLTPDFSVEKIIKATRATVTVNQKNKKIAAANVRGLIPFVTDRSETDQIFVKNTRTLTEHNISDSLSECRSPIISADGSLAAFIYGTAQNGLIRMVDLKTLSSRTVSINRNVTEIFFDADNFLYFIASGSRNPQRGAIYKTKMFMDDIITVLEFPAICEQESQREPRPRVIDPAYRDLSLSPDGSTLLFCAEHNNRWQIFAVDTSMAAAPTALTTVKADNRAPRFSPNGKFIAYLSDRGSFGGKMDLWITELKRPHTHKQITFHANVCDYRWGRDSKTVYFSAGVNITDINSINIKNSAVQKLTIQTPDNPSRNTGVRIFEHNKRLKTVYTSSKNNSVQNLRMIDIRNGRDEPVFRLEEAGNERTE